jgi:short-subunit dehydrogenase
MAQRGRVHIVFVSSLSGLVATRGVSMYNATKFGLRGFAHALRLDMEPVGIGVSVVLPGFIRDSGMFAEAGVDLPPGFRTSSPEDVARGVVSAIENNRGEVLVAPIEVRIASKIGTVSPNVSSILQKVPAARRFSASLAEAQRGFR